MRRRVPVVLGAPQFLSRDPLVATTLSPYGYVDGNPLNATDPSGMVLTSDGGASGDVCSSYSAANAYCEATLQACSDTFTRDVCIQVGQLAVDQLNRQQAIVNKLMTQPCQWSTGKLGAAEEYVTELTRIVHVISSVAIPEMNQQATCDTGGDLGIVGLAGSFMIGGEMAAAFHEAGAAFDAGEYTNAASSALKGGVLAPHAVGLGLGSGELAGGSGGGC